MTEAAPAPPPAPPPAPTAEPAADGTRNRVLRAGLGLDAGERTRGFCGRDFLELVGLDLVQDVHAATRFRASSFAFAAPESMLSAAIRAPSFSPGTLPATTSAAAEFSSTASR